MPLRKPLAVESEMPLGEGGTGSRAGRALLSGGIRPMRFAMIGVACAVLQLGLLTLFVETAGLGPFANAAAFLITAQVNFLLNYRFTWADRGLVASRPRWVQFLSFNALVAVAVVVNQSVYIAVERFLPYIVAGAVGIGATTVVKFLAADRWIFIRENRREDDDTHETLANAK